MAKKPPQKKPLAQRVATDRGLLKRALRDPGLRAKLPEKYLSAGQRQQRQLNVRLNAPITPGSTITERALARQAKAAETVQYGPEQQALQTQLGASQQAERDTGSYYDEYLAKLAQGQRDIQNIQAGAQQALQQVGAGITGIAGQDLAQLQGQAGESAAARGTQAANLAPLASQAAATRQALVGSFQAQQDLAGGAANVAAAGMADVVGPQQKLAALNVAGQRTAKVRGDIAELGRRRGAYQTQYREQARQEEAKNVLARQTLGLNTAKAKADIAAKSPEGKAAATAATEEAKQAAKLGLSVHQYRLLGPAERARRLAKKSTTQPGSDVITSGALTGKTKTWVAAHPDAAGKIVDDYNAGKDKGKGAGKNGKGPDWVTSGQAGTAMTQVSQLKELASRAKAGLKFEPTGKEKGPGIRLDRHKAAQKILSYSTKLKNPVLASAALDAVYDGRLSRETVRRLIQAGYKPSQVASTLGVPTAGKATKPSTSNYYGGAGAGSGTR